MRGFLLFSCLSVLSLLSFSQDITTLSLHEKGRDQYFEKSKLIAPVFRLKGNYIEAYEKFGVKPEKAPEKHQVKLPPILYSNDTGYTFIYSGVTSRNRSGYTPVVVLDYYRRMKPAILLVDHNLNYDFTDDGAPDTFYLPLHHLDIELSNPDNPNQKVTVRLGRFDFNKEYAFKKMVDDFYSRYSGEKEYVGTDFSFREQRYNVHYNDFHHGRDSFRISLVDINYNGLFNEPGIDKIYIDPYKTDPVTSDFSFDITSGLKNCYFERGFKSFKVVGIDSFGGSITFFNDTSQVAQRQLLPGKKVPKISFIDSEGKKVKLNKFRRKYVYVYFWNKESPTFREDTSALRIINEKFGERIKIIALNYGDNPKLLKDYVTRNNMNWLNGIATKQIVKQFQVESVPYGFLLKKRRRLKDKGITPAEVLTMLESGQI